MPFEAHKLYQEYEPDKYKTSTQKKAEGVLKEAEEMKREQRPELQGNEEEVDVEKIIILDQANFYRYPTAYHKVYDGEDYQRKLKIKRDWMLNENWFRETKYTYEIQDKITGEMDIIKDSENQQYLEIPALEKYMGKEWKLVHVFGDYDLDSKYERETSERIITVFIKSDLSNS